jgi:ComEC/Rec2-related protein
MVVRTLVVALGYCSGVGVGVASVGQIPLPMAVCCLVVGGLVSCMAVVCSRFRGLTLVLAVSCLGLAAGSARGERPRFGPPRGLPNALLLEATGPGRPGAWCTMPTASGKASLDVEDCVFARGNEVVVPRQAALAGLELPGPAGVGRAFSDIRSRKSWRRDLGGARLDAWVSRQRTRAWRMTRGDRARSLVVASTLGLTTALSPADRDALRGAGIGHLIAVSGLHVMFAALSLFAIGLRVSALLGRSPRLAIVGAAVPLLGYVALTGASPSAVRATLMLSLLGLGFVHGRPVHPLCSVAVAAALMLLLDPSWMGDVGFQLSVAAMLALLTARPGSGLALQTWRITWTLAPITLLHFGTASAYGLIANLVALPVFSWWILPLGLVGFIATGIAGAVALQPAALGAGLVLDLAHLLSRFPAPTDGQLAIVATCFLLVSSCAAVRVGWARRVGERGMLPPSLSCVAIVALVAWPNPPNIDSHWYAVGGSRSRTVIAPDLERGGRACIAEPNASAPYGRLLEWMDVHEVVSVGHTVRPHTVELRQRMLRGSPPSATDVRCAFPPDTLARATIRACLERTRARKVLVRGNWRSGARECFVDAHWLLLGSEET